MISLYNKIIMILLTLLISASIGAGEINPSDTILQNYINRGYLDAAYTKTDSTVIISSDLYYLGLVSFDSTISDYTNDKKIFTQKTVEEIIWHLNDKYQTQGFYYSEIKINKIIKHKPTVDLYLLVNKGPAALFRQLNLIGLERSRPEIVKKYFANLNPVYITSADLAGLEDQASKIEFLKYKKPLQIVPLEGYQAFDINLRFEELRQFYFNGAAGVVPNLDNSFVWDVNFRFINIFGGGRNIEIFSSHPDDKRNILNLSYSQPLFLIGQDRLKLELSSRDYRGSFFEFVLSSNYSIELNSKWRILSGLKYKDVKPDQLFPSYRSYSVTAGMGYYDFDNNQWPRNGSSLNWLFSYHYRRYKQSPEFFEIGRSINETRNDIKFEFYLSPAKKMTNYIKLQYLGLETKESLPPISELYLIGGPKTIRGFKNEQFPALRSVLATFEPQFVFNAGRIYPFVDFGYLTNRVKDEFNQISTAEDFLYGYGFGLTLIGHERRVDLSFGWNKELAFDQPRLAVELISGF